uniref:Sulfurtransferase n=1 Tax=Acidobacterium capsulatum TaxID=33075 RepID=A0A7V5CTF5_9BACT
MLPYEITATEAAQLLEQAQQSEKPQFILLDVRDRAEIQTARVPGALWIPMGEIPSRVQELDPDTHIATMCHAGVRSMNVAVWLRDQGFEKVQSIRGGIDAWSQTVDPSVPRY